MQVSTSPHSYLDTDDLAVLREELGRTEQAHDETSALFNCTEYADIDGVRRAAHRRKKPMSVQLHPTGTLVQMRDGTWYRVGPDGAWRKAEGGDHAHNG